MFIFCTYQGECYSPPTSATRTNAGRSPAGRYTTNTPTGELRLINIVASRPLVGVMAPPGLVASDQ